MPDRSETVISPVLSAEWFKSRWGADDQRGNGNLMTPDADGRFHMIGGSVIVAPTGEIAARALTEEDEVIVTRANLQIGANFREHVFNFAKHRRPEFYGLIVERTGAGEPVA